LAREQRRLAAIVAADVVGYSRLMGRDESGTVARLREHRQQRLEPVLARHGGRLVKLTGDGALVEFPSAVDALGAAIDFQQAMAEANRDQAEETAIVFRIGLHLGDLIVEGDDLYGDGVNVAARLEAEAPPGGIVISGDVHNAVTGRLKASFDDLGTLSLKNIERPVRAFGVRWMAADWKQPAAAAAAAPSPTTDAPLAMPDKPSIAVLPFQNMSGDSEQEYFADGMVEDIITGLSRNKSMFVIARNSSFAYKGKSLDIRQVGRELGVRYVLEGSVRRAGSRIRITGQLIDAVSGAHLWADRYEGELADIFDLQDHMTEQVIGALHPSIRSAEVDRARRKRPENLDAYDLVMRALPDVWSLEREANARAEAALLRALEIEPDYPKALALAAWCRAQRSIYNWSDDPSADHDLAIARARQAARLAADDPFVLAVLGASLTMVKELDQAATYLQQALALDPNAAWAWNRSGWLHVYTAQPEIALEHFERALRLSPFDQMVFNCYFGMGGAHFQARRFEKAIQWYEKAVRTNPSAIWMNRGLVSGYALAGRMQEATECLARLRAAYPDITITAIRRAMPFVQEAMDLYVEGLRLAGVPE
jgi:adenylate cyclase